MWTTTKMNSSDALNLGTLRWILFSLEVVFSSSLSLSLTLSLFLSFSLSRSLPPILSLSLFTLRSASCVERNSGSRQKCVQQVYLDAYVLVRAQYLESTLNTVDIKDLHLAPRNARIRAAMFDAAFVWLFFITLDLGPSEGGTCVWYVVSFALAVNGLVLFYQCGRKASPIGIHGVLTIFMRPVTHNVKMWKLCMSKG